MYVSSRKLEGKEVLTAPTPPSPGVRVAMIIDDGCPIELLEFAGKGRGAARPRPSKAHRKRGETSIRKRR
jgi:hypothetical protein